MINHATTEERGLRQRDLLPPDRMAECLITVVGVGAIGRQVALQLAAMGVSHMQLIDHDTVQAVNLGPQGYAVKDIGQAKVEATVQWCRELNPDVNVETHAERFRREMTPGDVLFCCVDRIQSRQHIWRLTKDRVRCWIDGRMHGEVIRILAAADEASRQHYPTTLFDQVDAYVGACTSRSTIYTANIAAGLMIHQFARFLRSTPVEADITLNLLASEMTVTDAVMRAGNM